MLCLVDKPASKVIELYIDGSISYTALSCYMSYNGFNLQQDFDLYQSGDYEKTPY